MEIEIKVTPRQNTWNSRREFSSKPRVYIFVKGENILENLANRTTRPHAWYRKEILPRVAGALNRPDVKFKWSQYAGCSCPCSPGFIVQDGSGYDVYVTVTDAAAKTTGGPARDDRAAQLGLL